MHRILRTLIVSITLLSGSGFGLPEIPHELVVPQQGRIPQPPQDATEENRANDTHEDRPRLDGHITGHPEQVNALKLRLELRKVVAEHPAARFLTDPDGLGLHYRGRKTVSFSVRDFDRKFQEGAGDPDKWLVPAQLRHSLPDSKIKAWLEAPVEKRVFIIGSGKDSARIHEMQAKLAQEGIVSFFYDNCTPLCTSQVVGAFCKEAHDVIVMSTDDADTSSYVRAEKSRAAAVRGNGPGVVLMDPTEYLSALGKAMLTGLTSDAEGSGHAFGPPACDPRRDTCH